MRLNLALITVAAMLCSAAPAQAAIVDVLSGDVIQVDRTVVHIANIDAPSLNSPCASVRQVGEMARAKLAEFVSQGEMVIQPTGERDDNARPMALVSINGEDVGEKMITAKLAQRHGQARDLCPRNRRVSVWQNGIGPQSPKPLPPMPSYGIRGGAGQRSH
jgi:endonuclease YncB( thermonuclease family)